MKKKACPDCGRWMHPEPEKKRWRCDYCNCYWVQVEGIGDVSKARNSIPQEGPDGPQDAA